MDAGRQLVIEREGRELPSIVEICAHAGYSRGAFYRHFRHRDGYMEELLEEILYELAGALVSAIVDGPPDLRRAVQNFVSTVHSPEFGHPDQLRTAYLSVLASVNEQGAIRDRHAKAMRQVIDRLAATIREGQQAGHIRPEIDAHDVATLLTLVGVTGVLWVDAGVTVDADSVGETILRLLQTTGHRPAGE